MTNDWIKLGSGNTALVVAVKDGDVFVRQDDTLLPDTGPVEPPPVDKPPVEGMELGMNLGGIHTWSGAFHFANLMYSAGQWSRQFKEADSGPWADDFGKITAGKPTDQFRAYLSDGGLGLKAGTYTVINPDGCKIAIGDFSSPQRFRAWSIETEFTFEYDPKAKFIAVWLEGNLTANNGNLAIIQPGMLESWKAGNPWSLDLLDFYTRLNIKTLRFLDTLVSSNNIEEHWNERTPPDALYFRHPLARNGSKKLSVMPWELVIDLCNRLEANPFINIFPRTTSDYVAQLATLFKSNLRPGLKPIVEHGNEIWNQGNPWGDGTGWVTWLHEPKTVADVDIANKCFILPGHGLVTGDKVASFSSRENRIAGCAEDWRTWLGVQTDVEVLDADRFKLRYAGKLVVPPAKMQKLMFLKTTDKQANVNQRYMEQTVRNWDIFDAALGAENVIHAVGSWSSNVSMTTARMNQPGAERADIVTIAPYFQGPILAAQFEVEAGSITPKGWVSSTSGFFLDVAIYPAGANPTDDEAAAGVGALAFQRLKLNFVNGNWKMGQPIPVEDGESYEAVLVYTHQKNAERRYAVRQTLVADVAQSPQTVHDSYTNQALRDNDHSNGNASRLAEHAANSGQAKMACYEAGYAGEEAAPAEVVAWRSAYMESAEYAELALKGDLQALANAGCVLHCHYADVLYDTHAIATAYGDTVDQRFVMYEGLAGSVQPEPVA